MYTDLRHQYDVTTQKQFIRGEEFHIYNNLFYLSTLNLFVHGTTEICLQKVMPINCPKQIDCLKTW